MSEVCLVNMPYGAAERPSFALSLLKACLEGTGIEVSLSYANLLFAREIGVDLYKVIEESAASMLIGEWTFAAQAFPDHRPDCEAYRAFLEEHEAITSTRGPRRQSPLEVPKVLPAWEQICRLRELAEPFLDGVVEQILARRPRIVGCSSTFQQHCPSLALLRRVRRRAPEVVTLLGGSNCEGPMGVTTRREFPWIDFVVSGEAEDLFPDLCRRILEQGRDLDPAELPPGVLGERAVAQGVAAAPRAMVRNFDNVPTPDYRDYFEQLGEAGLTNAVAPGLLAESARGCWWGQKAHCTFCGLVGSSMEFRAKSPRRVVEEFLHLSRRYGVRSILVVDDIISMGFFQTVLPALAEADQRVTLFYETKANLKREQMQAFADAGVHWIQPGIESMHQEALDLMLKGNTPWMNVQVLKWAQEMGIRVLWWMLHGIPEERDGWYSEIAEWLPQLVHLQPPMGMNKIEYHRFSPYTTRPADFGLRLRAHRSYGWVYPLSQEAAYGLAYYFEDEEEIAREAASGSGHGEDELEPPPGLAAVQEVIGRWRQQWGIVAPVGTPIVERPPVLSMIETADAITVYDSRPGATRPEHSLRGLPYRVYKACDQARTLGALVRTLERQVRPAPSPADVESAVAELLDRKILLALDDHYLSLAVREPIPLLPQRFPGGQVLRSVPPPSTRPAAPQPVLAGGRPFMG